MVSPTAASGAFCTFTITTNGTAIDSTIQVAAIDTWSAFGVPSRARITVFDGDPADEDFPISAGATFAPGASITVALGYNATNQTVFSGTITAQQIEIDENSSSKLIVDAVAKDSIAWSGKVPPPILILTYGTNILDMRAETIPSGKTKVGGEVRFQGSSLAVPGAALELAALGSRFNGTALIVGVHQNVSKGFWLTAATFGEAAP